MPGRRPTFMWVSPLLRLAVSMGPRATAREVWYFPASGCCSVATLLEWVSGGWRWLCASVLSAVAARVHSGWFGGYPACNGDDLDGGVFCAGGGEPRRGGARVAGPDCLVPIPIALLTVVD
jgi:hypothetical protein